MDNLSLHTPTQLANDSPEMRAWRLKRVRNLANLSREQMCEGGEINRNTLISWENGRFGGLTMNGAFKILARITQENVYCSLEWLMNGVGPEPSVNPISFSLLNNTAELNEDIIITYELKFFKTNNHNAVDMIVDDEGMLPEYQISDYVAGKKKMGQDIQLTIGRNCIVQTESGDMLLRNVREGIDQETYTLVCNNPAIQKRSSIIHNAKLVYAAPVIWHRIKDK